MPTYSIFGGILDSDLIFPELKETSAGRADWVLRTAKSLPAPQRFEAAGEYVMEPTVEMRLYRHEYGLRLTYSDTGIFEIRGGGHEILWCPGPAADIDAARLDVIGTVLALALHESGLLCLHGSAVALGGGGVGFVAPKRHGKSTLARALTRAGALLATDDTLPVMLEPSPLMRPGVHHIRLWNDSAAHFDTGGPTAGSGYGGKHVFTEIESERLLHHPVPLEAVYVLVPVRPDAGDSPVRRTTLPPVIAALSLVRHAKCAPLLGGRESSRVLDRAGDVARAVPIYRLEVARDFSRLDQVAEQLIAWHGRPAARPLTSGAA